MAPKHQEKVFFLYSMYTEGKTLQLANQIHMFRNRPMSHTELCNWKKSNYQLDFWHQSPFAHEIRYRIFTWIVGPFQAYGDNCGWILTSNVKDRVGTLMHFCTNSYALNLICHGHNNYSSHYLLLILHMTVTKTAYI